MQLITGMLTVYAWSVVAIVCIFFFLIARFYEQRAGQRSYYQLFLLPPAIFLTAGFRYALFAESFVGDVMGDFLLFVGGALLCGLTAFLSNLMMGRSQ